MGLLVAVVVAGQGVVLVVVADTWPWLGVPGAVARGAAACAGQAAAGDCGAGGSQVGGDGGGGDDAAVGPAGAVAAAVVVVASTTVVAGEEVPPVVVAAAAGEGLPLPLPLLHPHWQHPPQSHALLPDQLPPTPSVAASPSGCSLLRRSLPLPPPALRRSHPRPPLHRGLRQPGGAAAAQWPPSRYPPGCPGSARRPPACGPWPGCN